MRRTTVYIILGVLMGLVVGIGGFTFFYARGASYLTDNPEACANCHVMRHHYDAWLKSSHRSVAVCNDCHTPEGFAGKYFTKALNGFMHSYAFTTGAFPDALRITYRNEAIADQSCRKCHSDIIEAMDAMSADGQGTSCIRCHGAVGHQTR